MIERYIFLSKEYRNTLRDALNEDELYEEAASKINNSYTLEVLEEESKGIKHSLHIGYTIEKGKMTDVWEGKKETPFLMSAPYGIWVEIVKGRLNSTKAFMTRKLKVKGSLKEILRSGKATDRLIKLLQSIPTEFEGSYKEESFP